MFLPKPDQVLDFSDVFRAVVEGCRTSDQTREHWLQFVGKGFVVIAILDMVENVVEDVEYVETAALC